jgi:hypothetical protein
MHCRSRPLYRSDLDWIFSASRSLARSPDRPGLHWASLAFGAAAFLRLLPHKASRRQAGRLATLSLRAVAFSLRLLPTRSAEDLSPPIQGPCLAHQAPRLRRAAARLWGLTARCRQANLLRKPDPVRTFGQRHALELEASDPRYSARAACYERKRKVRPRLQHVSASPSWARWPTTNSPPARSCAYAHPEKHSLT